MMRVLRKILLISLFLFVAGSLILMWWIVDVLGVGVEVNPIGFDTPVVVLNVVFCFILLLFYLRWRNEDPKLLEMVLGLMCIIRGADFLWDLYIFIVCVL